MRAHNAVSPVLVGALALAVGCQDREPSRVAPVGEQTKIAEPARAPKQPPPSPVKPLPPCASDDCKPFLIAKLPTNRGTGIALAGGYAYVSTFFDNAVYRIALQPRVALKPSATPTLLYRSPGANLGDIEVHGDELRWSSNEAGRIYAAPISGNGPIRVIADTLPGIWGFASDEEWIYWADFGGSAPGTVWKKPLHGGPSVAISRYPASQLIDHVFIQSPSDLLFTDQSSRVLHTSTAGETADVWIEVEGDLHATGVAQDDTHVYIAGFNNRIVRVNKATREVELFATDPASPAKLAVDATHVYWVDYTPVELWGKRK